MVGVVYNDIRLLTMSRWRVQSLSTLVLLIDMTTIRKGQERTENGQDNATVPEDNGTEKVKEREGVIVVRLTGMVACFVQQPTPIRSMPAALMRVAGGLLPAADVWR